MVVGKVRRRCRGSGRALLGVALAHLVLSFSLLLLLLGLRVRSPTATFLPPSLLPVATVSTYVSVRHFFGSLCLIALVSLLSSPLLSTPLSAPALEAQRSLVPIAAGRVLVVVHPLEAKDVEAL